MAFPIIPKKRSGSAGNPTSLQLGELAVNCATGELFLGGDGGVMLLNPPTSAGTTVTEHTGDGTTVAFTFTGFSTTADGAYLVSVGGIDQPPSKYSVSSTAGGTITFVDAPIAGELISIRAIVAGSGGGGDGNATSIQSVAVSATAPSTNQALVYNGTNWAPADVDAAKLQGFDVSTADPTNGQFLKYDGTNWLASNENPGGQKWVETTSYQRGDIVVYQTNDTEKTLWVCVNATTGIAPPTTNAWVRADANAITLQGVSISTTSPISENLLKFDGTNWVPFDGIAIPNWRAANSYSLGDKVYYEGLIYSNRGSASATNPAADPSNWDQVTGGSSSPGPSDSVNVAYWMRFNFEGAYSYIPVYR